MRKKGKPIFFGICLFFVLGVTLFTFQSCTRDQASEEQPESLGIAAIDNMPSWSPDGKKIAFVSYRNGHSDIYIMNADGSDQTRLTDNPARDVEPSWSPDSRKIVFASDRDGNFEIYTMNADGSSQTRLTDNSVKDGTPFWSPDGTRIAFLSFIDGNMDIYTLNTDGTDQTRLTDHPAPDLQPSWSPDGHKIAFISARDRNSEIYVMNADGSDQTRLTDNPTMDLYPAWSPDSKKISFNSNRSGDGNLKIYTMNADGSNQSRLTNEPFYEMFSTWSPDGAKIAFCTDRDFDMEVYVMDADGSGPINLTKNAPKNAAFGTAPLPHTEVSLDEIPYKIVFESYRETEGKENWEICQIDADGTNLINLTNTPDIDELYPHASPDGHLICFVADEGEDKRNRIRSVYYMNIDGTSRVKVAENAYQSCWSPNGNHIAYLPGEFPRYDPSIRATKGVEIYSLETGEKKQHPNEEIIHINRLCWSPGGNWFVATDRGFNSAFQVDGQIKFNLTTAGCTQDISPDGKRLVWNATDYTLNIGNLDFGSPESNVTDHTIVIASEPEYFVYHADWSPDGNYLTFSYFPAEGGDRPGRPAPGSNICICDLRTGKWTQITTDGKHNKEPDWVPVKVR
jgi:Tol biopolymer transport system component